MSQIKSGQNDDLPFGLYELLDTAEVLARTERGAIADFGDVEVAESPEVLAQYLRAQLKHAFSETAADQRVSLANSVLELIGSTSSISDGPRQLLEIRESAQSSPRTRPTIALNSSALLTNSKDEPNLGTELFAELSSADSVDLICAFVRWHGIRVLEGAFKALHSRGIRIRVLTTTYIGATERKALDELARRYGAEVKVNYELNTTRLHAKAWLFRRRSGFDTAYVGSSNLSHSALVSGLEWNVRLSQSNEPDLLRKFEATFESYWCDSAFETYDPEVDGDRLSQALARGGDYVSGREVDFSGLEVTARPYQQTMLEALSSEREVHDRHSNLIVAATGTGKTVVAGLDYRRLLSGSSRDLSILFIAHRKEILTQSLSRYRAIMVDSTFGELLVDGNVPTNWTHVFASIQSLHARGVETFDPKQFDVIVIDEFHHAEAKTYRAVIDYFKPIELLGLTATPERADGVSVKDAFFGGRSAAELRLWDALEDGHLVPFQYFGIADDVDLSDIGWKHGDYDVAELEQAYSANDNRSAIILKELSHKITDVSKMRALGFCVSVKHAAYMAGVFEAANIPSRYVHSGTPASERAELFKDLRAGRVNCVFAVDLLNEGIDIPQVDTVLFLRPTQSATIFLQQLGRGLRQAPGKSVLTVLDFIGHQRKEFRFENKFRALTGASRSALVREISDGFSRVPAGSQIILDRVAQRIVLDNVRNQVSMSTSKMAQDVRSHSEQRAGDSAYGLGDYLEDSGQELRDIYRIESRNWTSLARAAGIRPNPTGDDLNAEGALLKRSRAFLHVDDGERSEAYMALLEPGCPNYANLSQRMQAFARMLIFLMWPNGGGLLTYDEGLELLRRERAVSEELQAIVSISSDRSRYLSKPIEHLSFPTVIRSHATYRREEILAGIGYAGLRSRRSAANHQPGVAWSEEANIDALLVTLQKSERNFLPSTMYRDYALNPSLFHWETQNSTTLSGAVGKRYVSGMSDVVLFARNTRVDADGLTGAYVCLGAVDYVSHVGEKPMAITWKLKRDMPADVYLTASTVAR